MPDPQKTADELREHVRAMAEAEPFIGLGTKVLAPAGQWVMDRWDELETRIRRAAAIAWPTERVAPTRTPSAKPAVPAPAAKPAAPAATPRLDDVWRKASGIGPVTPERVGDDAWQGAERIGPGELSRAQLQQLAPEQRLNQFVNQNAAAYGAESLDELGTGLLAAGPIRAWHGSPHKFAKFSAKKIGAGEGGQLYGHGLYFGENRAVGQQYRDNLTESLDWRVEGGGRLPNWIATTVQRIREAAGGKLPASGVGRRQFDEIVRDFEARAAQYDADAAREAAAGIGPYMSRERASNARDILHNLKLVEQGKKLERPGALYEVEIKAEPDEFLHWDLPIRNQPPAVRRALGITDEEMVDLVRLRARYREVDRQLTEFIDDDTKWLADTVGLDAADAAAVWPPAGGQPPEYVALSREHAELREALRAAEARVEGTGRDAWHRLVNEHGGREVGAPAAAQALRDKGVAGVRYLDQFSRRGDVVREPTHNVVVFDDAKIDILKRYGLAGLMAGGAAGAASAEAQESGAPMRTSPPAASSPAIPPELGRSARPSIEEQIRGLAAIAPMPSHAPTALNPPPKPMGRAERIGPPLHPLDVGSRAPRWYDTDPGRASGDVGTGEIFEEPEPLAFGRRAPVIGTLADLLADPSQHGPGGAVARAATVVGKGAKAARTLEKGKNASELAGKVAAAEETAAQKLSKVPKVQVLAVQLGEHPTTTARRILWRVRHDPTHGYSVNLKTGKANEPGIYVGLYPNTDAAHNVNVPSAQLSGTTLREAVALNNQELARDDRYLGVWDDTAGGRAYVEPSARYEPADENLRPATKAGEWQQPPQKALYYKRDVNDPGSFPPVGDWYAFITGPEFQRRLDAMEAVGAQHMGGVEWWNLYGGPFEEIYGRDWIRPIAGLLASTSPRTPPEKNLRLASEYIRRLKVFVQRKAAEWNTTEVAALQRLQAPDQALAAELKAAMIQPDYRVPTTAQGTDPRPGAMLFDESSRMNNILKAARGDLDAMQADKVNDMAHALVGDPVAVIDRRFAKLADSPAEGIYVTKANTVTASMREPLKKGGVSAATGPGEYALIENAVRDGARRAGKSLEVYSSEVWEGIGETIARTGELFGTKHPAGAIPESSYGFNTLLPKIIAAKAKHLGLTVDEMIAGLRAGKVELLTALLSTPAGWAAYETWQREQRARQR